MSSKVYPIAFCSAIQERYLQDGVLEKDNFCSSFSWWLAGELDSEPVVHQLNVRPLGADLSPFCATFALRKAAHLFHDEFSENCGSAVTRNFTKKTVRSSLVHL